MTQEKKPGLKVRLALFAKEKYPNFINGGEFETFSISLGFKASNGSRRCRELADEGTLERRMNGKSVEYRYKSSENRIVTSVTRNPSNYRCTECSRDAAEFVRGKPRCPQHLTKEVTQPALL